MSYHDAETDSPVPPFPWAFHQPWPAAGKTLAQAIATWASQLGWAGMMGGETPAV